MTRDHVLPAEGSRWTFDEEVTEAFDDMLRRSIPDYDTMRRIVLDLGSRFVVDRTWVVSLGCSRGEDMAPFVDRFGVHVRHLGLEVSEPMIAAARERFAGMIDAGFLEVRRHDLRTDRYPAVPASLTLAVLTLQFTPIEYRSAILRRIYETTRPGGAFILVEKVLGEDARGQDLLVEAYHQLKAANGYSADEIAAKRRSLEGVLVPMTARNNEEALRIAGFETVQEVWRAYNFAAWVAIKSSDGSPS